eukprot:766065-Hanusia_phi.AAC.1
MLQARGDISKGPRRRDCGQRGADGRVYAFYDCKEAYVQAHVLLGVQMALGIPAGTGWSLRVVFVTLP